MPAASKFFTNASTDVSSHDGSEPDDLYSSFDSYDTDEEWAPNPYQEQIDAQLAFFGSQVEFQNLSPLTPSSPIQTRDYTFCPINAEQVFSRIRVQVLNGDFNTANDLMKDLSIERTSLCNHLRQLATKSMRDGDSNALLWCVEEQLKNGFKPVVRSLNFIIANCTKAGRVEEASSWWNRMVQAKVEPNLVSFNSMIHACAKVKDVDQAEFWMQQLLASNIEPCAVSFTSLINAFVHDENPAKAEWWFVCLQTKGLKADAVLYHTMINAFAKIGDVPSAKRWFEQMRAGGTKPSLRTYNIIIHACAKAGMVTDAEEWYEEMRAKGFTADQFTFSALINACAAASDPGRAEMWIGRMISAGLLPNNVCLKSLMRAYSRSKLYERADHTLRAMLAQGFITQDDFYQMQSLTQGNAFAGWKSIGTPTRRSSGGNASAPRGKSNATGGDWKNTCFGGEGGNASLCGAVAGELRPVVTAFKASGKQNKGKKNAGHTKAQGNLCLDLGLLVSES